MFKWADKSNWLQWIKLNFWCLLKKMEMNPYFSLYGTIIHPFVLFYQSVIVTWKNGKRFKGMNTFKGELYEFFVGLW